MIDINKNARLFYGSIRWLKGLLFGYRYRIAPKIILDIGGIYLNPKNGIVANNLHPFWHDATFISVNIDYKVCPFIIDNAVTLRHIKDESIDGLYSSHTIEHISESDSSMMFKNWYRVLKHGGRIEIRCPDIEWTWREYFNSRLPENIITELMMGISKGKYQFHKNMFWESKLTSKLSNVGFINIRRIDYGFSIPGLDYWAYDGEYSEYHGYTIKDLLIEAYK
jgi:hypothetical protein